jgi:phage minor structural protein
MIEVYVSTNTNYKKNGDITLTPLSCYFEMGLDGISQIELTHEYDDLGRWEYLVNDNVIAAPTPYSDKQLFRIYKREKSDDEVTVYARHIFYDNLGNYLIDVRPTDKNGQQALDIMFSGTKFTAHSDITTVNTSYYVRKNIVEAIAGDDENSFINRWGGERLYDNYDVYIMRQIGSDKGVRAEFGHNLEAIEESVDDENVVTRIIPVAYNGYTLEGSEPWVDSPKIGSYAEVKGAVIEFSNIKLQEDCSTGKTGYANLTELRAALVKACEDEYAKGIDEPTVNYNVNMVELANTVEYKDYKQLETVEVGDTIYCRHKAIKIEVKARCIRIKWNCITKENEEVELGNFLENYFDKTSSNIQRATASVEGANSQALAAKEVAQEAAKESAAQAAKALEAQGKAEAAAKTATTKASEAQAAAEGAANQVALASAQAKEATSQAELATAAAKTAAQEKTAAGEYAAKAASKATEAQAAAEAASLQAQTAGEQANAASLQAQAAAKAQTAAVTAQGKAETAQAAAEAAKAAAVTAQGKAEIAQAAAEAAKAAAVRAQGKAEAAEQEATSKTSEAVAAKEAAVEAQGKTETARTAAEAAKKEALAAQAAAEAAKQAAENATGTATTKAEEAEAAKAAAVTARTKAEAAQSAAENAQAAAEAAKAAAVTARGKAETAQAAAEAAKAAAVTAQGKAETVKAAAEAAKAAAVTAQGKAENAQAAAEAAKATAVEAQGKAEAAARTATTKASEAQAAAASAAASDEHTQHYYELTKELYDNASIQAGQSSEAWLDLSYFNNCYLSE